MREKLIRFMYGRYGHDSFNRFLTFLCLGLLLIGALTPNKVSFIMANLASVCAVYSIFRTFSKNIGARSKENNLYNIYKNKFTGFFKSRKSRFDQRKDYCFFKCNKCGQTVRVPKGRGKIEITCPKCQNHFIRKS